MLKLWGRTNSINVMKVLWCLDELGLEYEREDAGMKFGVVNEDFYAEMNPNRKVPTLEDDGLVLWESNVIVRYLSAKFGLGTLCPEDPGQRALSDQWMDWQQTTAHASVTYISGAWCVTRRITRTPSVSPRRSKISTTFGSCSTGISRTGSSLPATA